MHLSFLEHQFCCVHVVNLHLMHCCYLTLCEKMQNQRQTLLYQPPPPPNLLIHPKKHLWSFYFPTIVSGIRTIFSKGRVLRLQVLRGFNAYLPNTWSSLPTVFYICRGDYGFQTFFFPHKFSQLILLSRYAGMGYYVPYFKGEVVSKVNICINILDMWECESKFFSWLKRKSFTKYGF